MEFGVWHMEFGVWHMEFGIWHMEFGVWHMVCFNISSYYSNISLTINRSMFWTMKKKYSEKKKKIFFPRPKKYFLYIYTDLYIKI